nr:hypothetical protein [Candidatus Dojkabacteria bacterium]
FGTPVFFGTFLPQYNILSLGYLIVLGFALMLPFLWDFSINRKMSDISQFIWLFIGYALWNKLNFEFNAQLFHLSSLGTRISGLIILIIVFILSNIFWLLFIKNHRDRLQKFFKYFPISTIAILLAFFLPIFSRIINPNTTITNWDLMTIATSFYIEYIYTLTILSVAFNEAIKYLKAKDKEKESNFITILKMAMVFLIFVYQFSTIIGDKIAISYESQKESIFPNVSIIFNKDIIVNGKPTMHIENVNLLSKDSDSYYFFILSPKMLYQVNKDYVQQFNLNKK